MSSTFLADNVWPQITKAAKVAKQKCYVAVAYFSEGGSKLLPLAKGPSNGLFLLHSANSMLTKRIQTNNNSHQ